MESLLKKGVNYTVEGWKALLRKYFYKYIYSRKGACRKCGKCCRKVYLREDNKFIKSFDQYLKMIKDEPKMKRFQPKGRDSHGYLYFGCEYISKDNLCLDYENRPELCRHYPSLSMIRYSAFPKDGCGFYFVNHLTQKKVTS